MLKNGKDFFLRIYIDNEKGISLEDCEKVNNEITNDLDKLDFLKEQYFLEVSSPGIERIIRKDWQLNKYLGSEINVKLFKKDERNNKEYKGKLKRFNENELILENDMDKKIIQIKNNEILIERKNISLIKTVYNWE